MANRLLFLVIFVSIFQTPYAFGSYCAQIFTETTDYSTQFLKELKPLQETYRNDLYRDNELDPQFFKNFARKTIDYYSISEVVQNYPIPQARESVENVLKRLKFIRDHWPDFKIESHDSKYFSIQHFKHLIEQGEILLKNNKWPFFATIDFIDAGLTYGTELRSPKEVKDGIVDTTHVKIREKNVRIHGQGDPANVYMYWDDRPGRAFEYLPHPAIILPFFVQNRLFEIREFNWAMTKGAFLISVAPLVDISPHGVASSYWSFYHDFSGHFKGTAILKTQSFLENIYVKKGLQEIDQRNRNNKEAIALLKSYIDMREDFLTKLLTAGEQRLSVDEQKIFHEIIFDYLHENGGAAIEPKRMHNNFIKHREKNFVNDFIIKTLSSYIEAHNLEKF